MLRDDLKLVIFRDIDDVDHRLVDNVAKRLAELSGRSLGEVDSNEGHGGLSLYAWQTQDVGVRPGLRQFIFVINLMPWKHTEPAATRQNGVEALCQVVEGTMDKSISSLIDRTGLDRGKVRQLIGRGLEGAD